MAQRGRFSAGFKREAVGLTHIDKTCPRKSKSTAKLRVPHGIAEMVSPRGVR